MPEEEADGHGLPVGCRGVQRRGFRVVTRVHLCSKREEPRHGRVVLAFEMAAVALHRGPVHSGVADAARLVMHQLGRGRGAGVRIGVGAGLGVGLRLA